MPTGPPDKWYPIDASTITDSTTWAAALSAAAAQGYKGQVAILPLKGGKYAVAVGGYTTS